MTHSITLKHQAQAGGVLESLKAWVARKLADGKPVTLTVEEERRNLAQNALLHALLTDIARTHEWAGKRRDVETWKRLFVAAWCRARGEAVEMLPALDGHGVDIVFRRTSKMSKPEVAELIEYVQAWAAENGD